MSFITSMRMGTPTRPLSAPASPPRLRLAIPLIGLIAGRQWKMLGAYGAAGFIAVLSLSISGQGITAPRWHFDLTERLSTTLSQFLDDPRWIAMLAVSLR